MQKTSAHPYGFIALLFVCSCSQKPASPAEDNHDSPQITLLDKTAEQRIDVLVDGKLFTSYRWPEGVYKPVLYPVISAGGNPITRGFPIEPREGERQDHRHQVGNWLNYGDVNGYDFWGNGHSGERSPNGGEIKHTGIEAIEQGQKASLVTTAQWLDPSGKTLLNERTIFHFQARGPIRIIDRATTLKASGADTVRFKDTKEGMFGLRVARQLELPGDDEADNNEGGNAANVRLTGNYRSSEGVTGEKVWSTRAKWMNLYGRIGDENVSVVICDHPKNINFPTYWHARGYGLFAANPLGAKDFTGGKEQFNFTLPPGDSVTFRYRIVVASGDHLTDEEINSYANDFAGKF